MTEAGGLFSPLQRCREHSFVFLPKGGLPQPAAPGSYLLPISPQYDPGGLRRFLRG
jgi:hypothetical protein